MCTIIFTYQALLVLLLILVEPHSVYNHIHISSIASAFTYISGATQCVLSYSHINPILFLMPSSPPAHPQ